MKYLSYGINYHKVYLCLGRFVRCFLFQSCVLLSPLWMVTSVEIQNLSFCNKFFSRLYAMLWKKIEKNLKELLTNAHPYNTINNVDDEMHTYVPCKQRCDSCANFVVAKSSFKCFATKRIYKVRWSTSCISKNVIYIAFCLNCLKQGVGSTVDWKPRLRNYKSHIEKKSAIL